VAQTTWAEIPELRRDPPRSRIPKLALRLLVPLAFAVLLWLLGVRIAAVLVLVAVAVLVVISALSPALSGRIERWMARFGHVVGRGIAVVLLGIVDLFVFAPVALVMWLLRYDPLAPGVRRDEASFWHGHAARSLPKRQFADERALWTRVGEARPRRRPILRLATAVGLVTLLLAADLAGGWVYDEVSRETHGTAAIADDTFDPASQPALRDSPWIREVLAEQTSMPETKDSYLGYRLGDKRSQYTNIIDGVRASYEPAVTGARVSVWFFGASSLFGDGQRDDHTIPSEFARLAEADGIPVEVRNYGRPGTAMWQELELFEQAVSQGERPDLVVFYDGFNDLAWQMNVKLSTDPINIFDLTAGTSADAAASTDTHATAKRSVSASSDTGIGLSDVLDAYWDQSASHHVYDALHDLIAGSDKPPVQFAKGVKQRDTTSAAANEQTLQAAKNAVSIQARAATLATSVARGVGADVAFFWQPNVFTKKLLTDEEAYLHLTGYQPERWDPAVREVRTLLERTPYIDLGDSLDRAPQPVLWDFVHTNEEGARLSAIALYAHLRPKLEQRIASGKVTR
jgi:lysophospholipase L1-like esterase